MKMQFGFLSALVVAALVVGAAVPAKAIMINSLTVANNTTQSQAGPGSDRAGAQSLAITDSAATISDAVGASVNIATRYISNAAADRPIAFSGSTARQTWNTNYTVNFSIIPDLAATTYNVVINTSILGELTLLDDVAGTQSTARVSDVSGFLGVTPLAGLGISGIAQTFSTGTGSNAAEERNISGSNSINLGTFSGPQSFSLRFTFLTEASAPQSVLGADEAAARFGANGPLGGATADDYPGPGDVVDRNQALDGHFMTATVNVLTVPEPSTFALLGLALFGMAAMRVRRK